MSDFVVIELDRPRKLKYSYTALKTLSQLTGKSIDELDRNVNPTDFDLIEKMVFCGLQMDAQDSGESLTIDDIPNLLDKAPNFTYIVEKIMEAWLAAFGVKPGDVQGNQQQPAQEPDGKEDSTGKKA